MPTALSRQLRSAASDLGRGEPCELVHQPELSPCTAATSRLAAGDKLVISSCPADREFAAFSLREGRVQARMAVNTWDRMGELSALIRSGDRISGTALAGSPRRTVTTGEAVLSLLWTVPVWRST